jgi:hypothetical protein
MEKVVAQPLSGPATRKHLPRRREYDELKTLAQVLVQSPRRRWKTRRLWQSTVGEVPQLLLV